MLKRFRPIIIVRIYNGKRPCAHGGTRAKHGMGGTERLFAAFGQGYAFRQHIELLISIAHFKIFGHPVANSCVERAAYVFLNKEYHLVKAGAVSIEHGKVDYYMPFFVHGVYLFKAAVAAAHSRRHYDQYRFFHSLVPS